MSTAIFKPYKDWREHPGLKTTEELVANQWIEFNFGSDATGDIVYRSAGTNLARLGIGAEGEVLTVVGGLPSWQPPAAVVESDPVAVAKTITLTQGGGMAITGSAIQSLGSNPVWTVAHSDTSSVFNLNTSVAQVIDELTFDTYGHVQTVTTRDLTLSDLGYTAPTESDPVALAKTITLIQSTGITVTGTATQALSTNPSWTISSTITQYTDALARSAISLTTIGTSGAATYNSTTGVLNIPNYAPGTGSVTSVNASISGAISVSGGPITTSGTLAFSWTGTTVQYVRGDGSLATFPTIPTDTNFAINDLTFTGDRTHTIGNYTLLLEGPDSDNYLSFNGAAGLLYINNKHSSGEYAYIYNTGGTGSNDAEATMAAFNPTGGTDARIRVLGSGDVNLDGRIVFADYDSGLTSPTQSGTKHMLTVDSNGVVGHEAIPSAGTDTNFVNTDLTLSTTPRTHTFGTNQMNFTGSSTGTNASLNIANTSSGRGLSVTSTTGTGINVNTSGSATGVYVTSGGTGGVFDGNTVGIQAYGTNIPIWLLNDNATTNSIETGILMQRTGGNGALGVGIGIKYDLKNSIGSVAHVGDFNIRLTNATSSSEVAAFDWKLRDGTGVGTRMSLAGSGQLQLNTYGTGTHTGTAAKWLAVTSSGLVIEENAPSGGGVTSFAFTDGNGFDGTVSTATTTPTLSLITTVTDNHIMYSNSGAVVGSANMTFNDVTNELEVTGNVYSHKTVTDQIAGIWTVGAFAISNYNTASVSATSGHSYGAGLSFYTVNLNANNTFSDACQYSSNTNNLRLDSSVACTITVNQASGVRAISANAVQVQLMGNSTRATTISHVAGLQIYSVIGQSSSANPDVAITNYYALLIANQNEYGTISARITNRYAIYQVGTGDIVYLAGKLYIPGRTNAVDDTAAAAAGVAIGETYRNGSIVMVRVS